MLHQQNFPETEAAEHSSSTVLPRRHFLSKLGGAAALTALFAACTQKADLQEDAASAALLSKTGTSGNIINFGEGDIAILNYAFFLEQLEAQFYTTVTSSFYGGATSKEMMRFQQIRDHEIAHREFFKSAIGADAIPDIMFDLSSVDFTSRHSVVGTAIAFEDLGVSAYNGVAPWIKNVDYLLLAGKIVSVEARHAAYVRDLHQAASFANKEVVDSMGLDLANPPGVVAKAVKPYLPKDMSLINLPHR